MAAMPPINAADKRYSMGNLQFDLYPTGATD
jgi:hypothetical protein